MGRGHLGSSPQLHAVSWFLSTISHQAGVGRDVFAFRKEDNDWEKADDLMLITLMRMVSVVTLGT